jgi:hypothetical protein
MADIDTMALLNSQEKADRKPQNLRSGALCGEYLNSTLVAAGLRLGFALGSLWVVVVLWVKADYL